MGLHSLMLPMAVAEFVVAVWSAVLCSIAVCRCYQWRVDPTKPRNNNVPDNNNVPVAFTGRGRQQRQRALAAQKLLALNPSAAYVASQGCKYQSTNYVHVNCCLEFSIKQR